MEQIKAKVFCWLAAEREYLMFFFPPKKPKMSAGGGWWHYCVSGNN
jgi:hypothetical protein